MTKHTEGPWKVPVHTWFQVEQESALLGTPCLAIVHEDEYRGRTVAEAAANARLIAAAPTYDEGARTMLAALRALPAGFFYDLPMPLQDELTKGWALLEAAIEKTEGNHE